jgi:hypothetical protein
MSENEENKEKPNYQRELENCIYIIEEIKKLDLTADTDADFRRRVIALTKISDV